MSIHEMWLQATKPAGTSRSAVALPDAATAAPALFGCRETPQKKSTPFANTRVLTWRADRPRNR